MCSRVPRYVEGAALVSGFAAHVFDVLLARHLPAVLRFTPLSPEQRAEVEAARAAIARAADVYVGMPVVSAFGSAETPAAEIGASWAGDEVVTTAEAAVLLGVSERRARQLAAAGLGRKVGQRWVLDRGAVLAWRDRQRRSA